MVIDTDAVHWWAHGKARCSSVPLQQYGTTSPTIGMVTCRDCRNLSKPRPPMTDNRAVEAWLDDRRWWLTWAVAA